tara:strand:- start:6210 stop:7274 length:1065 start_codon:yes stop_codon:yes gene_type:complete
MKKTLIGFEGPEVWNGCVTLFCPKRNLMPNGMEMEEVNKAVNLYNQLIGHESINPVWYDTIEQSVFGQDFTWMNSDSKVSSFIAPKSDFITSNKKPFNSDFPWDINYVLEYYGQHFGTEVVCNHEIIYSNNENLLKFKGSKILVVAGGPTAKEVPWDPQDYDYIFSCNHFFLSEKMRKIKVDFTVVGGEIDMSNENQLFHDYLRNNETILCFEDRLSEDASEYFSRIKYRYDDRCVFAHTRYRGKPGVGLRLILYACFLGASEVHFVGVDGMGKDTQEGDLHNHAFQEEKCYSHKSLDYGIYRRHYVIFWDYVLNNLELNKKIKFQNLGEGHPRNQTTTISKTFFPLEVDYGLY